jgi:hypothetical protein
VPRVRGLGSRTTGRVALRAVTSVVVVASLAVAATACGAAAKSGMGSHSPISPPYVYTGTLPVSLQHTLTLPATLNPLEIFQCDHLASVPYGARTQGRDDCKYYGDAEGLVVARYHQGTKQTPVATVSAALTQSLEGAGWEVDRKSVGKFRIDGHGWHGVAFVYVTTVQKRATDKVSAIRAVVAVSPAHSKTS